MIKDYSWKLFEVTGNINSYMLYREAGQTNNTTGEIKTGEQEGVNINSKE